MKFSVGTLAPALIVLTLAGCGGAASDNEAVVDESVLNSTLLPELPRPVAAMDRADIIAAVDAAASAFALGADDREAQAQLVNRRFAIRLPFGCGGLPVGTGPLTVALRPDGKSMALSATPDIAPSSLGEDSKVEEAEGFWIARPWVSDERCPTVRAAPADGAAPALDGNEALPSPPAPKPLPLTTLTEKTAGLVQFFSDADSRMVKRDGRAYSAVVPVANGALPPEGVALKIEGRLRPFPTGQVVRCRVAAEGLRPVCYVSIQTDRVSFEAIGSDTPLAEWHN